MAGNDVHPGHNDVHPGYMDDIDTSSAGTAPRPRTPELGLQTPDPMSQISGPMPQTPGPGPQAPDPLTSDFQSPPPPGDVESGESRLWHFIKWTLAAIGTPILLFAILLALCLWVVRKTGSGLVFAMQEATEEPGLYLFLTLVLQIVSIVIIFLWWFNMRGLIGPGTARPTAQGEWRTTAYRVSGIVLMGVGLQVATTIALNAILPHFPEVMSAYEELVDRAGIGDFSLLAVLSAVIAAPLMEETICRGVVMEYALRAVCPEWRSSLSKGQCAALPVSSARFWVANFMQALIFGAMHGNVTQFAYAFPTGLLLGWVFWRGGSLAWSMGLHAVLNLSSWGVDAILEAIPTPEAAAAEAGVLFILFAVGIAVVIAGIAFFCRRSHPGEADSARACGSS